MEEPAQPPQDLQSEKVVTFTSADDGESAERCIAFLAQVRRDVEAPRLPPLEAPCSGATLSAAPPCLKLNLTAPLTLKALCGDAIASYFTRGNSAAATAFWVELLRVASRSNPLFYGIGSSSAALVLRHPDHGVRGPAQARRVVFRHCLHPAGAECRLKKGLQRSGSG